MLCEKKFKPGDHIVWCDEQYIVIIDFGSYGRVRDLGGNHYDKFYWDAHGEKTILKEEFEQNKILTRNW